MVRAAIRALLAAAVACAAPARATVDNPAARFVTLSAPDCAGPENIIAEAAGAPANATYLRVQHIGDLGTEELEREVANVVTWDVGALTGFHAPASAQRGYRDVGLPEGASAFQLMCGTSGFLINTWQFSHTVPLFGEGPSASIARDLVPPPAAFRDAGSTLLIEARVSVPWIGTTSPSARAVGQVSLFYYARDVTSGTLIAHVIELFDSRAAGEGTGYEGLGNDGVVAFASSPLATLDASGAPVQFVRVSPGSASMRFVQPWSESTLFRAELPYANFRAMLTRMKNEGSPALSVDPADYRIVLFGVLGEVSVGTGPDNVSMGASASDLKLLQSNYRPRVPR
jgi:hypothetical protein